MLHLAAQIILACSCVQPPPVAKAVKQAGSVFVGTITALPENAFGETRGATFNVTRVWKGNVHALQTIAAESPQRGMCNYDYEVGKTYVVYADVRDNVLSSSVCARTHEVTKDEPIDKALGAGKEPAKN